MGERPPRLNPAQGAGVVPDGGAGGDHLVFCVVVLLAAGLGLGFFAGPIGDPRAHGAPELVCAAVASLAATVAWSGRRTELGALGLAASLVASLQLLVAGGVWLVAGFGPVGLTSAGLVVVVSLAGGAVLAQVVCLVLLVYQSIPVRSGLPAHPGVRDFDD